jgi:hypothetical protein
MSAIWSKIGDFVQSTKYLLLADCIREFIFLGSVVQKLGACNTRSGVSKQSESGAVARAFKVLRDEGILQTSIGQGTFVRVPESKKYKEAPNTLRLSMSQLTDCVQAQLIRQGFNHFAD